MKTSEYKTPARILEVVEKLNLVECGDSLGSGTLRRLEGNFFPERFVVMKDEAQIVAWCARFKDGQAHIFVKPSHRRKGIGTKLLAYVTKKDGNCGVVPWCQSAHLFFTKNKNLGLYFTHL